MFLKTKTNKSMNSSLAEKLAQAKQAIKYSDSIIIGAGAGLSLAAGFALSGPRFDKYFGDFKAKRGIKDMYTGGFYPFPNEEDKWAWWSRAIWLNRYQPAPHATYKQLQKLVAGHDYFVLTTNVDHQFQLAGFDKQRLFYTQGDYGLFQSSALNQTFGNYEIIREMLLSQGFKIDDSRRLVIPSSKIKMQVSPELAAQVRDYQLNLRVDDSFVEDQGWHQAAGRFDRYIRSHQQGRVVHLELGVGLNTPAIIKVPFWKWVGNNPEAMLITIDSQHIYYPEEIADQTIGLKMDINKLFE